MSLCFNLDPAEANAVSRGNAHAAKPFLTADGHEQGAHRPVVHAKRLAGLHAAVREGAPTPLSLARGEASAGSAAATNLKCTSMLILSVQQC